MDASRSLQTACRDRMGPENEVDAQLHALWMIVDWIESHLSALDAKADSTRDEARGELDQNLALLRRYLNPPEPEALYVAASLPLVKGVVFGGYNVLSYLMESYLAEHALGDIPWHYTPSLVLMRHILNDRSLVISARNLRGELGEGLMSHIQDLLDTNPPPGDWRKMYRLLQDISQGQEILPGRYLISPHKVKVELHPCLGIGGEATVRPARMREKGGWKKVVVRIPHHSVDGARAASETRLQAIAHHQLKHENIVPFLGVIAIDNTLAIVMPLQEGGNAIDFLKSYNGSDKDVVTLNLLIDAASGVAHMHNMVLAIVHGDLKGENILVTPKFRGMLCDFGRTRVLHEIQRSRSIASPGGSERYLAPEMVISKTVERPTVSSDCYAFAMVILELTTLQPPFCERENTLSVGPAVVQGLRPCRPETGLLVGEPLWRLVRDLWNGVPEDRPPMQEVVRRLQAYRQDILGP